MFIRIQFFSKMNFVNLFLMTSLIMFWIKLLLIKELKKLGSIWMFHKQILKNSSILLQKHINLLQLNQNQDRQNL